VDFADRRRSRAADVLPCVYKCPALCLSCHLSPFISWFVDCAAAPADGFADGRKTAQCIAKARAEDSARKLFDNIFHP
jgi:hypothetical protein